MNSRSPSARKETKASAVRALFSGNRLGVLSDAVAAELTATDTPISTRSLGVEYAGIRQRWIVMCTASSRQRAQKSIQREYRFHRFLGDNFTVAAPCGRRSLVRLW